MSPNPFQPLLEAVLHGMLWFIPLLLAIAALKLLFSARLEGAAGERAVARVLNRLGEAALHDIILPDGRGSLTQIDHLVLTPAGLWVVETRNYAGQVLGQPQDAKWTQRLGRQRFTFQNPLRQNDLHLQALKALTPGVPMQGWVVFTDAARFPKGIPEGVSTLSTLKADLNTWLKPPADTSELPTPGPGSRPPPAPIATPARRTWRPSTPGMAGIGAGRSRGSYWPWRRSGSRSY